MMPLLGRKKCDYICIRLDTLPALDGQTDGIGKNNIALCCTHSMLARDRN